MTKIYQKNTLWIKSILKRKLGAFVGFCFAGPFRGKKDICRSWNSVGFTLIELLVVVLIIGILSAVALPQYKLSVEKARAAEALEIVKSLWHAQQIYFLANGTYHDNINELDIYIQGQDTTHDGVPRKETQYFSYGVKTTGDYVAANRLPVDTSYAFAVREPGLVCTSFSDFGKKICQNFAQQKLSYDRWLISTL